MSAVGANQLYPSHRLFPYFMNGLWMALYAEPRNNLWLRH